MRACDGLRALMLALLAALAFTGVISMAALLGAAVLAGVLNIAFDLARSAWIAQRVAPADLPRANAGLAAAGSVSETVAVASGGWLYQWAGAVGATARAALAPRLHAAQALTWGLVLATLASLCVPLAHGAGWLAMALIAAQQIVGDAGDTMYDVPDQTLRQSAAPADQLARVDAGIRSVGRLGALLGALGGGVLGTLNSPRAVLLAGAVMLTTAALWAGVGLARRVARQASPA
jgi:hypothetical protein